MLVVNTIKTVLLLIYEINHIWTTEMKWKWTNDRRSERNLCLLRVFREQLAWLVLKFLCLLRQETEKAFCSQLTRVGVARLEELEVNQWIVQDIHWLSSQSERAKTLSTVSSIYWKELCRSRKVLATSADNTLLDLHNFSYPTQPHSLIAKYWPHKKVCLFVLFLKN